MKLITSGLILNQKLINLIKEHDNISIAVAWASAETEVFKLLRKSKKKIQRIIIGTHFHQTHPDVLDSFIGSNKVRFMLQPQGVFHPKAFLFWSKENWDILIGSANLTAGALSKNSEIMLHISSNDVVSNIHSKLKAKIDEYWQQSEIITTESASKYRTLWKTRQPDLKRVSGAYTIGTKSKAPIYTKIMSMSWSTFFKKVQSDLHGGFNDRCDLLDLVREEFKKEKDYSKMNLELRKAIAGLLNSHYGDLSDWFGKMVGSGRFYSAIIKNNKYISTALNLIPLDKPIGREHYNAYVKEFKKAFPDNAHRIGVASRLLALKRPDCFVCLDSKNKRLLCADFGIKQSNMTYDRYWDEIICRIVDSVWWNEPKPASKKAIRVWLGRAAMLDALFYEPY